MKGINIAAHAYICARSIRSVRVFLLEGHPQRSLNGTQPNMCSEVSHICK